MPHQLRNKGPRWIDLRACQFGQLDDQIRRLAINDFHHAMAPLDGEVPFATGFSDPHAHTSQVLNQCHPQHEGQRPEFTDFQRPNRLVGRYKAI